MAAAGAFSKLQKLPPYPEMIMAAVEALRVKNCSNTASISDYIESTYADLPQCHASLVDHHLDEMKRCGLLVLEGKNYSKPDSRAPLKRRRGRPPKPKPELQTGATPSPPRPRGSPPKPRDLSDESAAMGFPRSRGRPPKKLRPVSEGSPSPRGCPSKMDSSRKHTPLAAEPMIGALKKQYTNCESQLNQPLKKRMRCLTTSISSVLQPLPIICQEQNENQSPLNCPTFQSGHIDERLVDPQSHQHLNMTPRLHLLEQSNEVSSTSASNLGQHRATSNLGQQRAKRRAGRGPARQHAKWGTGEKLKIQLDDSFLPIGDTASTLQSQLGILARNGNLAPLTFTDWRARELEPYKERIWEEVKANTDAPDVFKHNCLMSVGKKWKEWKDKLKRDTYDHYNNDKDRLDNCPLRVNPDQWRVLVQYWGNKNVMARSKKNRESRQRQTMGHTSGRKSHCRVRDELRKAKGGVEPDRIEVFTKTHTKKNGLPVDEASSLAMKRLNEGASQIPTSEQSSALREELFVEVLKPDKNGRVRTFGLGPCPSQVFGTRYSRYEEQRIKDKLRAEVRQEVLEEVGGEISKLKSQLKRKYARMIAHLESIGHPLPPSPTGDANGHVGGDQKLSMLEHNEQFDE